MLRYRSKDGDMIDDICHRHYGRTDGTVEAVLKANQGLADLGPVLEAGVIINLPDLPDPEPEKGTSLWD
ncbi:tail protein X [Desulfovibrio ferrophilus]|uniref:Tail X family protein n=1 Tax=Desulfovibrio ferrophilus TaxID=241368 RepID=A0A2Z6AYU7_9BACT|nr:tail protein X [Desulfovibrio ferrophilus]BBD08441.1 tail X family protein [Desulfovibrio ferrophilus]